jgi:hypothetical protein
MICGIKAVGLWFAWLGFVASQPDAQVLRVILVAVEGGYTS